MRADIVLLDLGVSSMQLDRPERGFSYAVDAPLDMRMDPSSEYSARELVNDAGERELADIFKRYGEERYARQIARAIVRRRQSEPFERTGDLVETIKAAIPAPARFGEGHPAKRVFQALRIEVNDELGAIERALPAALEMLRPGGRLAVISFHSLEDRLVKQFLRTQERGCTCPPDFPVCVCGSQARAAGDAAPGDPPVGGRGRPQPARPVGAAASGGRRLARRASHAAGGSRRAASPRPRGRRATRVAQASQSRARGGDPLDRGQRRFCSRASYS